MSTHTLVQSQVARVPGVAVALIMLCTVFALTSPGFTTATNIANVLTQSTILFIAVMFMAINLAVDLLYGVLDPRIRYSG